MANITRVDKAGGAVKKQTSVKKPVGKKVFKATASKASTNRKTHYLTKRILVSAAATGFAEASERTMKIMGENVIVKDGWVVRIFADGHIEKILKIERNNNMHLALD